MREAWTDERLDDLNQRVSEGFAEMRSEFRAMREEFRAIRGEMGASSRSLTHLILGSFVTMLVGFAATIATILIQT